MKKIEIKDRPQLSIAWDTNHRPSVTNQKLNLNRRRLGHAHFPALQAVCLVLLLLVIIFFFSDWLLSWLILNQRKASLKKNSSRSFFVSRFINFKSLVFKIVWYCIPCSLTFWASLTLRNFLKTRLKTKQKR